jgi:hypothetical protein
MALSPQRERYVRNEWLFREVNERISEVNPDFELGGLLEFLCECGQKECLETLPITRSDYERVRSEGDRFVIKPGHQAPAVERVVEEHPGFLVVMKVGEAGEESEEQDPRS